jgi:hypothetical protein
MFGVAAATAADSFPANYGRLTRTVQVEAIEMAADVPGGHGLTTRWAGQHHGPQGNPAMTCSRNSQPIVGTDRYPVRYRSK